MAEERKYAHSKYFLTTNDQIQSRCQAHCQSGRVIHSYRTKNVYSGKVKNWGRKKYLLRVVTVLGMLTISKHHVVDQSKYLHNRGGPQGRITCIITISLNIEWTTISQKSCSSLIPGIQQIFKIKIVLWLTLYARK